MTLFTHSGKYAIYIYCPTSYERKRDPIKIYVIQEWPDRLQGNQDPEALAQGRTAHFLKNRCQPFNTELWAACEEWTRTSHALQQRFKDLAAGRYPKRFIKHKA